MRRLLPVVAVALLAVAGVAPAAATPAQSPTAPAEQASTGPAVANQPPDDNATETTTVTILTYNDIQTAISQNGTVPRMATLIDRRRNAHDNPTYVIGGGDEVSPHSLSPISQWREPIAVLNAIEPDAEVIGNHDLDFGFDAVANYSAESEFPWLMANIVREGTNETIPGAEPYTVIEKQGVKVGVVGIADEAIKGKTAVDFSEKGYVVKDHVAVAKRYATMLKEEKNVDVVVVAAHVGIPESKEIARGTENVDVIVTGDDEVKYAPEETGGTVIVEARARAEFVGEVNLTVTDGEVVGWNGRLWAVDDSIPADPIVAGIIERRRDAGLSQVVGKSTVALDSRFASNYHDETALGNMITDAFRWKTGAQVAITNAGGIRSNSVYGPGEITAGDVYSMLPFGNTLVTVELTGEEIKQLLESQVVTLESETGQQYGAEAQLQVSGVTYEWASHDDQSPKIRDVRINGQPLDPDATYTVTVNSYMKGWEGSVLEDAPVVSETKALYGTVVAEYMKAKGTVSPADHDRIRRIDTELATKSVTLDGEGTVTVSFDLPDSVESVNESTVRATTYANTSVAPTDVAVEGDTLTVTFDDADLVPLADDGGNIQIYAEYVDSRYTDKRVYFKSSVLNGEVDATVEETEETPTATPTETPTDTPADTPTDAPGTTDTEMGTPTAAGSPTETSSGSPGFGTAVALVALLAAALVATRRRD